MEIVVGRSSRRRTDLKAGNGNYTSVITVSDAQARESCDFTEPVFIMTRFNNYESCNYVYVSRWGRYYFINEITVNGNLIELHCVEDYLASWYSSIISQSLFCTRSYSDPNLYLADNVYPTESRTERSFYTFDSPYDARFNHEDGLFVLAVNGSPPLIKGGSGNTSVDAYIGMTNYYILPAESMTAFAGVLYDTNVWDSIKAHIEDPMDFIMKCYWLPMHLSDIENYIERASNSFQISLGNTSINLSDITSIFPTYSDNPPVYVWKSEWLDEPIPSFGKTIDVYPTGNFFNTSYPFQNHAPYSHMYLFTMPDGLIEMGDNVVTAFYEATEDEPMHIHYAYDITQGNLLLQISDGKDDHVLFERNMEGSIELQLTQLNYDLSGMSQGLGSISSGASLIGSGATAAGIGGIVSGSLGGLMAACKTDVENTGNTRGNFNIFGTGDWFFMRTYNPVNLYTSTCGLPCCKTETLSNLSGYAQFDPVNIKTANGMLAKEQQEIETLLRRGVYINE